MVIWQVEVFVIQQIEDLCFKQEFHTFSDRHDFVKPSVYIVKARAFRILRKFRF